MVCRDEDEDAVFWTSVMASRAAAGVGFCVGFGKSNSSEQQNKISQLLFAHA
jgi:hypothetical protein